MFTVYFIADKSNDVEIFGASKQQGCKNTAPFSVSDLNFSILRYDSIEEANGAQIVVISLKISCKAGDDDK